jgi:hypothetical protein
VTVIETSLRRGEDRAANHLDNLLDDLRFLRGVTEEKTAITLTDAVIRLEEARSKMASDAEGAIEGLKKLSSDLQRRATPDKDGKTEGPGA